MPHVPELKWLLTWHERNHGSCWACHAPEVTRAETVELSSLLHPSQFLGTPGLRRCSCLGLQGDGAHRHTCPASHLACPVHRPEFLCCHCSDHQGLCGAPVAILCALLSRRPLQGHLGQSHVLRTLFLHLQTKLCACGQGWVQPALPFQVCLFGQRWKQAWKFNLWPVTVASESVQTPYICPATQWAPGGAWRLL